MGVKNLRAVRILTPTLGSVNNQRNHTKAQTRLSMEK